MKTNFIGLALVLILLSSCASIMHGPNQQINFTSSPTGATITIDGENYGQTPRVVSLQRKARKKEDPEGKLSYHVKFHLDGYETYEMLIHRKVNGWVVGNIFTGILVGLVIDAANGSMYQLTPEQTEAQLSKSTASIQKKGDDVYFAVVLEADPSWKKIGQLEKVELEKVK